MPIPRVFHFIWISKPGESNGVRKVKDLSPAKQRVIQEWAALHPGFGIKLWTDIETDALMSKNEKWKRYFDSLTNVGEKTDTLRYLIMKTEGGVYADLDCYAKKNVLPIIESVENEGKEVALSKNRLEGVSNWIIFSVPGSRFWAEVEKKIIDSPRSGQLSDQIAIVKTLNTGPFLMQQIEEKYPQLVYLIDTENSVCLVESCVGEAVRKGAFFVHVPEGSWHSVEVNTKALQVVTDNPKIGIIASGAVLVMLGAFLFFRYKLNRSPLRLKSTF